jgi:hypothetical protein
MLSIIIVGKNVRWSSGEFLNTEIKFVVLEIFTVTIKLEKLLKSYSSAVSGGFSLKTQVSWKTSSRIELYFSFSSSSSSSSCSPLSVSLYIYVCLYLSVPSNWASEPSISELREPLSKHWALLEHSYRMYTNKTDCDYKVLPGGRRNSQTDIFLDMIIKTPATH